MLRQGISRLLLCICCMLCWPVHASLAPLQWPCQRALVTRAATNMPPFAYLDNRQQLTGYRVELLRQLFARLNCPLQIRTDSPWKRSLLLVEAGEMDMLFNASRSAEREQFALFSRTAEPEYVALFVLKQQQSRLHLNDIADALSGHYNIGIIRGNFYGDELSLLLKQNKVQPYLLEAIDKPGLYQLLIKKRVDMYLDYYPNGLLAIRDEGLADEIVLLPLPPQRIGESHYLFSRKSVSPAFVQALDLELAKMLADGSIAELKARYNIPTDPSEIMQQR